VLNVVVMGIMNVLTVIVTVRCLVVAVVEKGHRMLNVLSVMVEVAVKVGV
jgi:hypothetical protein